jgi:predicted nucleic acid-binding protein
MIFVDSGAWFSSIIPWDPDHSSAVRWLVQNTEPLLTTDYVVDETLTLLRARGERRRAMDSANDFFLGRLGALHFLAEDDIRSA